MAPVDFNQVAAVALDENTLNLLELAAFVDDSVGFRLGLATYDVAETRNTYLRRLDEIIAHRSVDVTRLDLTSSFGEESLLKRLREHLQSHPAPEGKHPAIMVVGIEATIDFRLILDEDQARGGPLLHNANLQRDAFPSSCPVPVVLWLNSFATTLLARAAPDLWHWRSGSFSFTGLAEHRAKTEPRPLATLTLRGEMASLDRDRGRIGLLKDLLARLELTGDRKWPGNETQRAEILHAIGRSEIAWPRPDAARKRLNEALRLYRGLGDRMGEVVTLIDLAIVYSHIGEVQRTIHLLERALSIAREVGDRRGEAVALGSLGRVYADLRQAFSAVEYLDQRLVIARDLGDRPGEAVTLFDLGRTYAELGQHFRSIDLLMESMQIYREIGDKSGEAAAQIELGRVYTDVHQADRALNYLERALDIAREIGDQSSESAALSHIRRTFADLGQPFWASEYFFIKRLAIAQKIGDKWRVGTALCGLGRAKTTQRQADKAIDYFQQAIIIFRKLDDRLAVAVTLANLAEAYLILGSVEKASKHLDQVLEISESIKDRSLTNYAKSQIDILRKKNR